MTENRIETMNNYFLRGKSPTQPEPPPAPDTTVLKAERRMKRLIESCVEARISKARTKKMIDDLWPRKTGRWPSRNTWWNDGPDWLKKLIADNKFLEPILTEIFACRHITRTRGEDLVPDTIQVGNKQCHYALIDLDDEQKKVVADKAGCSVSALKRYLAALVKCGVLKEFHKGKLGRYYSISYWTEYLDPDSSSWKHKRAPLLRQKNMKGLKSFKVDWGKNKGRRKGFNKRSTALSKPH